MCKKLSVLLAIVFVSISLPGWGQTPAVKDTLATGTLAAPIADTASKPIVRVDTVKVVVDTVAKVEKKDCYTEFYEAMRTRGAKPVPNGKQDVVIAIKSAEGSNCFMGQVEVLDGKIKPPVYVQQENGEYKSMAAIGKKLEPFFALSLTAEDLYLIKDGMSIAFKTSDNEMGRIFFYKFVNKSTFKNKVAPSVSDLIKD